MERNDRKRDRHIGEYLMTFEELEEFLNLPTDVRIIRLTNKENADMASIVIESSKLREGMPRTERGAIFYIMSQQEFYDVLKEGTAERVHLAQEIFEEKEEEERKQKTHKLVSDFLEDHNERKKSESATAASGSGDGGELPKGENVRC